MIDINYIKITQFDTANGPGIRTVLWVAGCHHKCKGCHNPETWDPDQGKEFTWHTIETILDTLKSKYISGVTISGGDPLYLHNRSDVRSLIREIKKKYPEKTIWLYTGYTIEEIFDLSHIGYNLIDILDNIDVLVEGRYIEELRDITLPYCGSTNQRVIDMRKTLLYDEIILYEHDE